MTGPREMSCWSSIDGKSLIERNVATMDEE